MSDELRVLYQQHILEHSRRPRNFHALDGARHADGHNPLCGDTVTVYVNMADGVLQDVAFRGEGCAIAMASASMMTEAVRGRSGVEAAALVRSFHALVAGDPPTAAGTAVPGALAVFAGVRGFPARIKCATLAWRVLLAALAAEPATVSTE
jgi:nitrogen fixation protein NifU and related proteins